MRVSSRTDVGEPPFGHGPGEYLARGLASRRKRVAACIALGEPAPFERVRPPGYAREIERCTRCLTLRKQHKTAKETER